jgi:hypothetical protein
MFEVTWFVRAGLVGIGLLLMLAAASGCATVHPWDRDLMAQSRMRAAPLPLEAAADDHIYFSKEGSIGAHGLSGGGCGCN